MKKRNKLGLISSIPGVFALCGLSALAIFSKPKCTQSVSADSTRVILYSSNGLKDFSSFYYDEYEDYNCYVTSYFKYNYSYYYTMVDSVRKFQFSITFGMYFDVYYVDTITNVQSQTYRYYLNYEHNFNNNPSVNNLTMITAYSDLTDTNVYTFNFNFKGFRSANSILDIPVSERGRTYYTFTDFTDSSNNDIYWLSTKLVDQNAVVQTEGNYFYFMKCFPFNSGYSVNLINDSFSYGFTTFDDGLEIGYQSGYNEGYDDGNFDGYNQGYEEGNNQGHLEGYNDGYSIGYSEGLSSSSTASTIVSGIFQVALVPINFFLAIFNFDILGVNLTSVIQAIMTITITIIIVKMVMGSRGS